MVGVVAAAALREQILARWTGWLGVVTAVCSAACASTLLGPTNNHSATYGILLLAAVAAIHVRVPSRPTAGTFFALRLTPLCSARTRAARGLRRRLCSARNSGTSHRAAARLVAVRSARSDRVGASQKPHRLLAPQPGATPATAPRPPPEAATGSGARLRNRAAGTGQVRRRDRVEPRRCSHRLAVARAQTPRPSRRRASALVFVGAGAMADSIVQHRTQRLRPSMVWAALSAARSLVWVA